MKKTYLLSCLFVLLTSPVFGADFGYETSIVPDLKGTPAYSLAVNANQVLQNGFAIHGKIGLVGLLDLDITSNDRLEATAEVRYQLDSGAHVVLSHRSVNVDGAGVVSSTFGSGQLTAIKMEGKF